MEKLEDKISASLVEFIEKEVEDRLKKRLKITQDQLYDYEILVDELRRKREEVRGIYEYCKENELTIQTIQAEANFELMEDFFQWSCLEKKLNEPLD